MKEKRKKENKKDLLFWHFGGKEGAVTLVSNGKHNSPLTITISPRPPACPTSNSYYLLYRDFQRLINRFCPPRSYY